MATIQTIAGGDGITSSRTDINTNFANLNSDKVETSAIDTDTTLSANSDSKIPSQKAVKAYVDTGGNVNAGETSKGIVEEATDAEVAAGSSTGGTGAKLFITPEKFLTYLFDLLLGFGSKSFLFSTIFETSARFTSVASGGTNTFDTTGLKMDTTSTGGRVAGVSIAVGGTSNNLFTGSPVWTAAFTVSSTADYNFDAYFGLGLVTVAGSGHTFTTDHCGFKILGDGNANTMTLYATQGDGSTETASSALTTLAANDAVELMLKMNESSSIDYYYRKNGGSWSSATNLTTNLPNTASYRMQYSITNLNTAQSTVISVGATSYSR